MKKNYLSWTWLVSWMSIAATGHSQKVGVKSEIGFSCFNSALSWNFGCPPKESSPFDCRCSHDDFLTTALSCVFQHADDVDQIAAGWKYIRDQCHYWGNRTLTIEELGVIYNNNKMRLLDPQAFNNSILVVPGPIDVPDDLVTKQLIAAKDTKYHYNVGNDFAFAVLGYWGLVMAGGIITNGIRVMCPNVYNIFGSGRVTRIRKALTLPALMGKKHHSALQLSRFFSVFMPTRGQFVIILGSICINIAAIVSFIDVEGDSPSSFISQSDRRLHYLANRTGIVSISFIPFIVLFGSRNNPFIYSTGWPYDIFMTYHRWCARFMAIHALIHAVAMYWSSLEEKVVIFKWERIHNWRGGNLAIYMTIIMSVMALRRIRSRVYEWFKITHISMFWTFIACMVVHLSDYGWLAWLYVALAFHVSEHSMRLIKIIVSGGIQDAAFTYVDGGLYRIKVPGLHRKWQPSAGLYVYIRISDKDLFWQAHPFSVFQGPNGIDDNSIELCCKAQLGSTRTILQKLIGTDEKSFHRKVLIEGPYGNENYVSDYESILLFAGGVGFTGMYSFASHVLERMKPGQYLCLIWVVKDCKSLSAFEPEIVHLTRYEKDMCNFRIFVTRPEELESGTVAQQRYPLKDSSNLDSLDFRSSRVTLVNSKNYSSTSVMQSNRSLNRSLSNENLEDDSATGDVCHIMVDGDISLNVDYGRPNIPAEVCDFIRTANGSKAICSCGPPMFVDSIRDGVVKSIMDSDARVDYFEDAFSW